MAFVNEWEEEQKLAFANGWNKENLFKLYIFDRLKKKNLHNVAEIFAQEGNLKQSQLLSCNDNLLEEWWETFWENYCSVASNIAGANGQTSGQSSMVNALGQLASQVPLWGAEGFHPSQPLFHADHMHYIMPPSNTQSHQQIPVLALEAPVQVTKDPKNDGLGMSDVDLDNPVGPESAYATVEHHAGLPAAQARGEGPLGFAAVQLPPTLTIPVPPVINSSHLQMAVTVYPPPQVARVKSTYPGGQGSTDSPAAPSPGEANRKDQLPLTGGQMALPGPDLASHESRVSVSSVPLMHQAQMPGADSYPPADQSSKEGGQEGSGSLPKRRRGRPRKSSRGKGTAK